MSSVFSLLRKSRRGEHAEAVAAPTEAEEKHNRTFRWATVERHRENPDTFFYPPSDDPTMPVGVVQALTALTIAQPYFEVLIVDHGAARCIGVGLAGKTHPLNAQPGWLEKAAGYHTDDGILFCGGARRRGGSVCYAGDIVGCGAEVVDGAFTGRVFFTREGRLVSWLPVAIPTDCLFPTVGLHSIGECVSINLAAAVPVVGLDSAVPENLFACEGARQTAPTRWQPAGTLPRFAYTGDGRAMEVAQVRTQRPLPTVSAAHVTNYVEMTVLGLGNADRRGIGIGLTSEGGNYPYQAHPGQRGGRGVGYLADGGLYESGARSAFWPRWERGDVIGVGVEHVITAEGGEEARAFFTRNRALVGYASKALPVGGLHVICTLRDRGDEIEVNQDARWSKDGVVTTATSAASAAKDTGAGAAAGSAPGTPLVTAVAPHGGAGALNMSGAMNNPTVPNYNSPATPHVIYASHGDATRAAGAGAAGGNTSSGSDATLSSSGTASTLPSLRGSLDTSNTAGSASPQVVSASAEALSGRPRDVSTWSEADVGGWLVAIGLPALVASFAENAINGVALLELTDDELKNDLNVLLGHRKVLMKALKELSSRQEQTKTGSAGRFHIDGAAVAGVEGLSVDIDAREVALGDVIGRGSFGVVYKGRWRGADIAIKKVLVAHLTPTGLTDLRREATIMKRLPPHPNVVMFLGCYSEAAHYCLVTQFCEGGSLYQFLHSEANVDMASKVRLAECAAAGMLHLSREGLVHRDLAARNVLVTQRPQLTAVIIDFGLSREELLNTNTTDSTMGPIKWMSPESLSRKEYSTKSDVWSFGVLLYEIFERKEPWEGMSNIEVAVAVTKEEKTLILTAQMPDTIGELMRACWRQQASERPGFDAVHAALIDTKERLAGGAYYSAVI